jgi:phosphatidylinositol glycan class Q protein
MVGYSGMLGLTTILSLISDALSLVTLHLYGAYLACAFIFSHLLRTAGSLWNLFRGKRYNVLRNRVDNWDYELDQLLFGTILFTLLTFLFPTIWVYYALFGLVSLLGIMTWDGIDRSPDTLGDHNDPCRDRNRAGVLQSLPLVCSYVTD